MIRQFLKLIRSVGWISAFWRVIHRAMCANGGLRLRSLIHPTTPSNSQCKKIQLGFTLVEVLVALFIFSILSVASMTVLTSALGSKDLMETKSAELRQRATLRILLKSDFANILAVPKTDAFGQPEQAVFIGGTLGDDRFLSMSRTGWDNPGGIEKRSNLQAVDYVLKDKVLVRTVWARFNPVSNTPLLEQPLMSGVERVTLGFFDGENWQENWLVGAPPAGITALPVLASIELELENGDKLRQVFRVGADQ